MIVDTKMHAICQWAVNGFLLDLTVFEIAQKCYDLPSPLETYLKCRYNPPQPVVPCDGGVNLFNAQDLPPSPHSSVSQFLTHWLRFFSLLACVVVSVLCVQFTTLPASECA